eukprot:Opistho-2@9140
MSQASVNGASSVSGRPLDSDRGWNDPPQLGFGAPPPKGVAPKHRSTAGTRPPPTGASDAVSANAHSDSIPPTTAGNEPPRIATDASDVPTDLSPPSEESDHCSTGTESLPADEPYAYTECIVTEALRLCAADPSANKKMIDEMAKRVDVLADKLRRRELSRTACEKMAKLAAALEGGHYDAAHDIHVQVLAAHSAEVTSWMVGVKRLIATAKTVSPQGVPRPK